jgi:uroporphyrinogen decarboxylase
MDYQPADRLPVYYFGTWGQTLDRWKNEGLTHTDAVDAEAGLDPDWESGMWDCHGLANPAPISDEPATVLETGPGWVVRRTPLGAIQKQSNTGGSIPQHIEEALKPTRESWNQFKRFLNPADPRRRADAAAHAKRVAQLKTRSRVTTFLGGSLFGYAREWLGVEAISYLAYDDPALFEEIIDYLADFFMELLRPIIREVDFDFVYFFEDCCGRSGPLFSPATYRKFYHKHYQRMIRFYRDAGIQHILIDSDGNSADLIACWAESGFDILFPIEVGTWHADPAAIRKKFGRNLRMFGGVDKRAIEQGEEAIRAHLQTLAPTVRDGGFIPIPDHRIPPTCSFDQFKTYTRVFSEVFNTAK